MNFTTWVPGLTDTWTRGVVPKECPSRKHVEGGIELMFKKASPTSAAAAGGGAGEGAGTGAGAWWTGAGAGAAAAATGAAATGAGASLGAGASFGVGASFGASVTTKVFSATPSSNPITSLKSDKPALLASSDHVFVVSMSTEMGKLGSSR